MAGHVSSTVRKLAWLLSSLPPCVSYRVLARKQYPQPQWAGLLTSDNTKKIRSPQTLPGSHLGGDFRFRQINSTNRHGLCVENRNRNTGVWQPPFPLNLAELSLH